MFTVDDRNRTRDRVLALVATDPRIVAGAVVGSLALREGDRWSDLDLTFAVAESSPVLEVLRDWTRILADEFRAVVLFDLPAGASIYRVFLLPGCLQFDLSFTPASASRRALTPGTLWLCGSSRAARAFLPCSRATLAGRVLAERGTRLWPSPGVP